MGSVVGHRVDYNGVGFCEASGTYPAKRDPSTLPLGRNALTLFTTYFKTLETLNKNKLHEHLRGCTKIAPLPSTFNTIHPIDMIHVFGTYELPLYFQLSVTTWCLTDFHGNQSYINDVKQQKLEAKKIEASRINREYGKYPTEALLY